MMASRSYKIIFAGTPEFSVKTLAALLASRHTVQAVYTQPDRPAGRGRKLTPSPVKKMALEHHLPVHQPLTLRDADAQQTLADFQADLMVVVAYGLILPLSVLRAPKLGCLNVHASLLPRWRGAAPIQRAILAGDDVTGITIMQMDQGLDTGAMLYKMECPIQVDDTSAALHDRLADLGARALLMTLDVLPTLHPEKQNAALATYAAKMSKEEAQLNWNFSAVELNRKIRAFNSWPVAWTMINGQVLRIWRAEIVAQPCSQQPGMILRSSAEGIDVATGKGILRLQKIQLPGARALPVADILNARPGDFLVGKLFCESSSSGSDSHLSGH
ncbi:MAG: hypothetical protein ACD_45C00123G0006 [uncultured bacterium]|nr:MAG: hypothetical protein ACD_45C00123G0006 [uncultured bacterium]